MPEKGPPPGAYLETAVVTSDTLVYTGAADVYWIAVSTGAYTIDWELNDSTNDSGTDKFAGQETVNVGTKILRLPTPLHFDTGIWVDIDNTLGRIVVGYVIL